MTYQPQPIDTSAVSIPEALEQLVERLSAHVHDAWAIQRIEDGWSYGQKRDDDKKLHPCLVPYDQLPESEKQYDRLTAVGTLKAILALGYTITPPDAAKDGISER